LFVTGSKTVNSVVAGTLEPRYAAGYWRDVNDNCLYVFGGVNSAGYCKSYIFGFRRTVLPLITNFLDQSVWKLNPTVVSPTWEFFEGSNATGVDGMIEGQPSPRRLHSCDAAPSSGGYCFGGLSYLLGKSFWHFSPFSFHKTANFNNDNHV
jgi:hypothetical protein